MSHSTSYSSSTLRPRGGRVGGGGGGGEGKMTAIMFIGNTGVGKSALLNQLGGDFKSGFSERHGVTVNIIEKRVLLGGEWVVLMDVPGLIEPSDEATKRNSRLLVEALSRGYNYKLIFVVQASNRTMTTDDMTLISEVNRCLIDAGMLQGQDGASGRGEVGLYAFTDEGYELPSSLPKISFRVIVNGVSGQKMFNSYEWFVQDKFQSFFADNDTKETPFDIQVDDVLLLPADDDAVEKGGFKEELTRFVTKQKAVPVSIAYTINVNDDLKTKIRLGAARSQGWMEGAVAGAVGAVVLAGYIYVKVQQAKRIP